MLEMHPSWPWCFTPGQDWAAFQLNNTQQLAGLSVLPLQPPSLCIKSKHQPIYSTDSMCRMEFTCASLSRQISLFFSAPHHVHLLPPCKEWREHGGLPNITSPQSNTMSMCVAVTITLSAPTHTPLPLIATTTTTSPCSNSLQCMAHVPRHTRMSPTLQRKNPLHTQVQRGSTQSVGASSRLLGEWKMLLLINLMKHL